jgi:hypothetical protein
MDLSQDSDIMAMVIMYKCNNLTWYKNKNYIYKHLDVFTNLNAGEYLSTFLFIKNEINEVRNANPFIFKETDTEDEVDVDSESDAKLSPISTHTGLFKFRHILYTLADKNVFNATKGTLHGVINAKAIDVLEYLNWEFSYNNAQREESKRKRKKR